MREWGARDARWQGIRSETVVIDGTEVHLLRADASEPDLDGRGDVPRLLVHGLGGAALNWLDVIGGLAAEGPVVAMDLPGFGATKPPHPHAARMLPQVKFLQRLVDRLGWSQVELHGNSMGGMISTLFAARYPDRVARLVLVNPVLPHAPSLRDTSTTALLRFAPFVWNRLGHAAVKARWRGASGEDVYDETLAIVLGDAGVIRPALREVAIENTEYAMQTPWRPRSFAMAATNMLYTAVGQPLRDAVSSVSAPTLLLWGDDDKLVSKPSIDQAARERSDWTRVDLSDVGHAPMLEVPDRFLEVVAAWRRDVTGTPERSVPAQGDADTVGPDGGATPTTG